MVYHTANVSPTPFYFRRSVTRVFSKLEIPIFPRTAARPINQVQDSSGVKQETSLLITLLSLFLFSAPGVHIPREMEYTDG